MQKNYLSTSEKVYQMTFHLQYYLWYVFSTKNFFYFSMLQAPIITPVQESHGQSDRVAKLGSVYQLPQFVDWLKVICNLFYFM